MDTLALAAVVGLVFAGKKLSEDSPATTESRKPLPPITRLETDLASNSRQHLKDFYDVKIMTPELGRRVGDFRLSPKNEVPSLQAFDKEATRSPFGQPVYDLYGRQNVTNKMNNLPPVERIRVGPGLGVGPDVPATGGFQQFFRVLPNNINEERLTTIEGRTGPANPVVKNGGAGGIGSVTHQAKATKAWTREPAQNQGQGQGGRLIAAEGRPDNIKTRKTTNRQETGQRGDTLAYGPAQWGVYLPYSNGLTDRQLPHSTGNRVNPDRAANGGRMNVRADPQGAVGTMTNLRAESVAVPVPHMNGGRFQNYKPADMWKLNQFKTQANPLASAANLNMARDVLKANPIAMPPLSVV
jgi:hypothetical protein